MAARDLTPQWRAYLEQARQRAAFRARVGALQKGDRLEEVALHEKWGPLLDTYRRGDNDAD